MSRLARFLGDPRVRFALSALVVVGVAFGGILECSYRPPLTPAAKQGEALYQRMCVVCHGARGEGYAADNAPAIGHPDFMASASDEFLRVAIANGRAHTTMSAWATERGGPLSKGDINAVIRFMRSWRTRPPLKLDDTASTGVATRGAGIYARDCAKCHGERGATGPYVHIGDRELLASTTNGLLRRAIQQGRPGTPMPAFEVPLGQEGVEDLIALLRSWAAPPAPPPVPMPTARAPLPLGPVPLHPNGPEPVGFKAQPATTPADVVHKELARGARMGILDARAPSDYINDHIAGAVSVPFYEPDPYFKQLPQDAWLVCYCSCPHAESGALAAKLGAAGFKKVTVLDEGLGVWKMRGYPTRTGDAP